MARLRQFFAQNYGSSANINAEIESIIRYLNAAEVGNKTIGELLGKIFDEDGNFAGPIEFRKDAETGIEYRIGEFDTDEEDEGWINLLTLAELRGEPGTNVGEIGAPIVYARQDYTPAAAQTALDYFFTAEDEVLVFVNGLLWREPTDYTTELTGGTGGIPAVVAVNPFAGTEEVAIFKIRSELVSGFSRVDYTTASTQSVFPFVHDESSKLLVFLNGILQREGGGNDYTSDAGTNTITFNSPIIAGNDVAIMTIENALTTAVTGLMLEENFCDLTTGLIKYAKIGVADGEIPQAKVSGLTTLAAEAATMTVSASTPVSPSSGDLWVDTSTSPNKLKFYDGVQWLLTTPSSAVPGYSASDASLFLRVNGTGTALEFAAVDLSSLIPLSQKGAASGVATLDSSAKLPTSQLPDSISRVSLATVNAGATTNGTYTVQRLWNQAIEADSLAIRLSAGTATAQFAINGVGVGSTYAISTTPTEVKFGEGGDPNTPQAIDATGTSKTVDIIITAASGATDLDIVVGASVTP